MLKKDSLLIKYPIQTKELSSNTEKLLMELQDKFLENREEKYITKMYRILEKFVKSLLLKFFRPYILNLDDLEMKVYFVIKELLIQYYVRKDFKITISFSSYAIHKARQIIFSGKYDIDNSNSGITDYYDFDIVQRDIKNNSIMLFSEYEAVKKNTLRIYLSEFNTKYQYWENYVLFGRYSINKFIPEIIVDSYNIHKIWFNTKLKSLLINIDSKDNKKFKLKIEVKGMKKVKGKSLNDFINVFDGIELGVILEDKQNVLLNTGGIQKVDKFNISEYIMDILDETSGEKYIESDKLNLHRMIAIRNRIVVNEDSADMFFKLFSNDAKIYYEKTFDLIYTTLKNEI